MPGVLQGCCRSGILGVIKLFLDGRLELLAEGVLGVLPTVFGVLAFCSTGVFSGVFCTDFCRDGVFVSCLPTGCKNFLATKGMHWIIACTPHTCDRGSQVMVGDVYSVT